MSERVTIDDVAAAAGVHKATVSRALNARTRHQVNANTAKKVQRAAQELGYVPNLMARSLRTSLSMTIGVILPDLTNPLFPPIVRGIESYLKPRSYTALVANTDSDENAEAVAFDSLMERRVDGLIVATGQVAHPLLASAHERGIHAVMVNRASPEVDYPAVVGDDAKGITESVEHLLRLGHRHIVHIAGPPTFTTSIARALAFNSAITADPAVRHETLSVSSLSIDAGEGLMSRLLESPEEPPTAIVAANDLIAIGVLRALRAHGLSSPHDLSVIGFNDIALAEDLDPPLSTVHVPHHDMGFQAARLLLERIDGTLQSPITVTLPVSLVPRSSTAPPRSHSLRP